MLTFAQAKKDSLIKWNYARKTGCDNYELMKWLEINYLIIYNYFNLCGFCERCRLNCCKCKLQKLWKMECGNENSLFIKWSQSPNINFRKKYAEKIYQDILSLEESK